MTFYEKIAKLACVVWGYPPRYTAEENLTSTTTTTSPRVFTETSNVSEKPPLP
jgi:hypothetical protein